MLFWEQQQPPSATNSTTDQIRQLLSLSSSAFLLSCQPSPAFLIIFTKRPQNICCTVLISEHAICQKKEPLLLNQQINKPVLFMHAFIHATLIAFIFYKKYKYFCSKSWEKNKNTFYRYIWLGCSVILFWFYSISILLQITQTFLMILLLINNINAAPIITMQSSFASAVFDW